MVVTIQRPSLIGYKARLTDNISSKREPVEVELQRSSSRYSEVAGSSCWDFSSSTSCLKQAQSNKCAFHCITVQLLVHIQLSAYLLQLLHMRCPGPLVFSGSKHK